MAVGRLHRTKCRNFKFLDGENMSRMSPSHIPYVLGYRMALHCFRMGFVHVTPGVKVEYIITFRIILTFLVLPSFESAYSVLGTVLGAKDTRSK